MKSQRQSRGSQEVGYRKPPKHSQFKLGQSGNPSGRPPGSKNRRPSKFEDDRLRTILSEEADRIITVQEANGKKKRVKTKRAIVRSIADNALKGQARSQQLFMSLVTENERIDEQERRETVERWLQYKQSWGPRFRSARPPSHLPHPDDVLIDFEAGTVAIAGPAFEEERPFWERWRKIRRIVEDELREFREMPQKYDLEALYEPVLKLTSCAQETLVGIDLALGGARKVMAFLQKLDLSTIEARLDRKKRVGRQRFIFPVIHREMDRQYRAETARHG